jgi:hypothetical protein
MSITFQKLNLFPSSGGRRETPTLLGPLERANLSHWVQDYERDSAAKSVVVSLKGLGPKMNRVEKVLLGSA